MIISTKKFRLPIVLVTLVTVMSLLIASCTKDIVKLKEQEREIGKVTEKQFVSLNYFQKLNHDVFAERLKVLQTFNQRSGRDNITIRDIIDNLEIVLDEDLFYEIEKEASLIYGSDYVSSNPFAPEVRGIFLDLLGDNADHCPSNFKMAWIGLVTKPMSLGYSENEINHFYGLLHFINNNAESHSSIISYLKDSLENQQFSQQYVSIIDYAINSFEFYEINEMALPQKSLSSLTIVDLQMQLYEAGKTRIWLIPILIVAALALSGCTINITGSVELEVNNTIIVNPENCGCKCCCS